MVAHAQGGGRDALVYPTTTPMKLTPEQMRLAIAANYLGLFGHNHIANALAEMLRRQISRPA